MAKSVVFKKNNETLYPKTVSALVYNNETGDTIDQEIAGKQDKLTSGTTIKTINGQSILGNGNIGVDQSFKGWYVSSEALSAAIASPSVGDFAYVKGSTSSDPVVIYECATAGTWVSSGREFNSANTQSFASGESVNTVTIADDIYTCGGNDLLSAGALQSYFGIQPATWEFTYTNDDLVNAFIHQTSITWSDGQDKWYTVMLPLRGHGTITVTKNPNGSCRYAFLRSNTVTLGSAPDFCAGTTLIQVSDTTPHTYDIPEDCRYFYAYVWSGSNAAGSEVVAPTVSVELFSDNNSSSESTTVDPGFIKLRYMHWNVGHFSLGNNSDTTTTYSDYPTQHAKWVQHVNTINADVFGCCEYNTNFVNASGNDPAIVARDDIFAPYAYAYVGTKTGYNQQALFSNKRFTSYNEIVYSQVYQNGRYYLVGSMPLGKHVVKFVETHLDLNQGTHTDGSIRLAQIQQLISDFSNDDYVVIAGDFNVASASEYDTFKTAGYNMVNHGYLGDIMTQPEKSAYADNIICKGFSINNIQTVEDLTVTDHKGIYADLTLLD